MHGDRHDEPALSHDGFFELGDQICAAAAESADGLEFADRAAALFDRNGLAEADEDRGLLAVVALSTFCEHEGERLLG